MKGADAPGDAGGAKAAGRPAEATRAAVRRGGGPGDPGRPGLRRGLRSLRDRLRSGRLGALPVVVSLLVTWIVFQSLNHNFLSPRNLSDICVDIVGPGLVAVGIVFVLLLGEVDLSVGSVSGLTAAIFAVMYVNHGVPEWLAIVSALLTGAAIGSLQGFLFARVGVPAFVVTLAGLLAWNGLMLYVLGASGTIDLGNHGLVAELSGRYLHSAVLAYGLAALGTGIYFVMTYRDNRARTRAGMAALPMWEIAERTAGIAVPSFAAAWVLEDFRGVPLALLVFLAFVVGLDFVLRRTTYGRRILAIGGDAEAARRSGINVVWTRVSAFAMSGTLAAIGGLFLTSRVASVGQTSGSTTLLINAIAAAIIGGVSLFGGRGTTWSALLGILVIQSIASGMVLIGLQTAVQYMVTGGVLLGAVILDSLSRRSQKVHGRA
ncbi:sugar ABC transporter permease [Actinacidiphila rubida]|uniref:Xylose transport system permease protein XylH n=1 Tax=Actinacidiphila rubida TaxID=310780 RepID=A0A1H8J210_9ACTN|nr:ABC transporter permease [Actinacidiphila rubida]SEN74316.1 D-xylose transport system permease protein [Actinacidiphila rubida]